MRFLKTVCLLLLASVSVGQEVNIIPKPVEMKVGKGSFIIDKNTVIAFDTHSEQLMKYLKDYLKNYYGLDLRTTMHNRENKKAIYLIYGGKQQENGYYELKSDAKSIIIGGNGDGLFNGIQTLIQLLPVPPTNLKPQTTNYKLTIPKLQITDYPRFEYRGMHLDCSRHFWSVDFVKQYIDYLALHKFNKFHWHLTDDQGWRIEIKKYPKLTAVGGWRNGTIIGRYPGTGNDGIKYGGYYTQEQIKEVVKYAADRYIDVIPEIEMPGHSSAAIAAYPELSCFPGEPTKKYFPKQCAWNGDSSGKQVQQTWGVFDDVFCAGQEKTFEFLKDVMDEVLDLFPSKYIHVGGDECPKENWKRCPHCQKRIKDNNMKDEHELQSYFIQRMEKYLNSKGRILIGWDEILEGGLAPNAVVMSWRGEAGGIEAAKQKHNVIMTPGNPVYFDHSQSENEDSVTIGGYNPIEKVYAYEPIPKELNEEEGKYVLGAQANLWTEYMKNTKKVEYMLFPRMAALSEVLWSKKENKNWAEFEKRLMMQFKRYDLWKANYSKAYFDLKATVLPTEDYNGILWKIESSSKNGFIGYPPSKGSSHTIVYKEPFVIKESTSKQACYFLNSSSIVRCNVQKFYFNKATGKKITLTTPPSKTYPGDGAFTLVNAVQNEKGMAKSKEFLGFSGEDCIATIDLGKEESISFVKVHYLHQPGSWIHQPSAVTISVSADGINFSTIAISNPSIANNEAINEFLQPANARYIKVHISNFGTIPSGNPGAGSKAWLFVDEIEIN
ncbi:MAG: family 20 glycosylhydrolase [Chitinophagaceae bacterium]|nr:family 20 glycosylhydrolase [Chitinophagaceae bacterium]